MFCGLICSETQTFEVSCFQLGATVLCIFVVLGLHQPAKRLKWRLPP